MNLVPPVTSKYTLFVKHPDLTDETHAGYNRFLNTFAGVPTGTGGVFCR